MYEKLFLLQEEIFKVIANQKRLEIIQLLSSKELSVSEMGSMLGLPQANLSQHLASLRQAHVVETRRSGVTIFYRLSDPRIASACELIKEFLQEQQRFDPDMKQLLDDQAHMYPVIKDVVCGMRISVKRTGASMEYEGINYYFCATGCKDMFQQHPANYVIKKEVVVHG